MVLAGWRIPGGATIRRMSADAVSDGDGAAPAPAGRKRHEATIRIPRWIQLVGLPVLLVLGWMLAGTLGHVLFLFLAASRDRVPAQPARARPAAPPAAARARRRRRLPALRGRRRSLSSLALGSVVVDQTRSAADRVDAYLTVEGGRSGETGAEQDVDRLQAWLDDHGLDSIQIEQQATDWVDNLGAGDDLEVHAGRDLVRAGRRVLDRPAALQPDPDRRHRRSTCCSTCRGWRRRSTGASRRTAAGR